MYVRAQFIMFMSGNIYTMVDLFDKAVAEEARQSLWKRGRKVTTRHKNIDSQIDSKPDSQLHT